MKKSRRFRVIAVVVLLALLLVVGGLLFWYVRSRPSGPSASTLRLQEVQERSIPGTKSDRYTYYANLGGAQFEAGDYEASLKSMKKADNLITDRSGSSSQTVNVSLAALYQKLGQKDKAREYYQREIDRLKGTGDNEVITYLQKQKDNV